MAFKKPLERPLKALLKQSLQRGPGDQGPYAIISAIFYVISSPTRWIWPVFQGETAHTNKNRQFRGPWTWAWTWTWTWTSPSWNPYDAFLDSEGALASTRCCPQNRPCEEAKEAEEANDLLRDFWGHWQPRSLQKAFKNFEKANKRLNKSL